MRLKLLAIAVAAVLGSGAAAQDYPTRPIMMIIPTAPGGGNDVLGRVLADKMSHTLGQQIVPENRGGAAGTLAMRAIAKSSPDGYTIAVANSGTIGMAPTLYPNAGYDPRKDFAPIGLIAASTVVLVVHPSVPAHSVQELIAFAKSNPGKLTFGSGGAGSASHLFAELFASMAGVKLTHVPFRGLGPATNDLLGGHISMIFSSIPTAIGNVRAGNLRALATTGAARSKVFPELPTIAEAGLPGYEAAQRYGLLAPAGTPRPIVVRLNAALRQGLESEEVKARIADEGADPAPGTPEDYVRDIDIEDTKWGKLIRDTDLVQK